MNKHNQKIINKLFKIILISFFIIFISLISFIGIFIVYFVSKGLIQGSILGGLLSLYLFFILGIIQFINGMKLYFYLKKKRPELLRKLLLKKDRFLFIPEYMRWNPNKFISFMSDIEKENDKKLKFYKRIYRICLILMLISFILVFLTFGI